ncbi:hypothetical protein BJ742DRAFT_787524 [Cladochytrium replicatum]|nr:hypothetical protein BJ742DRAFT_787524 [Cladochytrium replicatum]
MPPPNFEFFCVYNSAFGPTEETASQALLYFDPPGLSENDRTRQMGMLMAIEKFASIFSKDSCSSLVTKKARFAMYEPEPGYWMVFKVRLLTLEGRKAQLTKTQSFGTSSSSEASVDDPPRRKKQSVYVDDISESALARVLRRAYENFQLIHKGFVHVAEKHGIDVLRRVLEEFYSWYIPHIDFGTLDMTNALEAVHYLTLDTTAYSSAITTLQSLASCFFPTAASVLLYRHQLVHFTTTQGISDVSHILPLYEYITHPETGKFSDSVVNQVKPKGEPVISTMPTGLRDSRELEGSNDAGSVGEDRRSGPGTGDLLRRGLGISSNQPVAKFSGFLIGPLGNDAVDGGPLKLYIGPTATETFALMYQFEEDLTVVFLIPASFVDDEQMTNLRTWSFYERLQEAIEKDFRVLLGLIEESINSSRKGSESGRYIFHENITLGIKSSVGARRNTVVTEDIVDSLNQVHDVIQRKELGLGQLWVKTGKEYWVGANQSDGNALYSVLPKHDASLLDIEGNKGPFHNVNLVKV